MSAGCGFPEQLARDQRIDEALVDVEVAWQRAAAEQAVLDAEVAAVAIERLLAERLEAQGRGPTDWAR